MLAASVEEISRGRGSSDIVLDIGGWANPLPRADWVMDLCSYESRGLYRRNGWPTHDDDGTSPERFSAHTWIQRDICDREPFPFADDAIDFVVCAHTLEDVRDPVWVCQEMSRVARAGYVEVPSRREEQSIGVEGAYAGRGHHRWLIDVTAEGGLEFTAKPWHRLPVDGHHLPASHYATLTPEQRVECVWWSSNVPVREVIHLDAASVDADLRGAVLRELGERSGQRTASRPRWRRRGVR